MYEKKYNLAHSKLSLVLISDTKEKKKLFLLATQNIDIFPPTQTSSYTAGNR